MSNAAKKHAEVDESANMTVVKKADPEPVDAVIVESAPELTLEQRIHKVEDLVMLIDKFNKLKETHRNLKTFQMGTDGFTNQLSLRSLTSGFEFKTSNTAVFAEVLTVIDDTLTKKIAEIESQIKF